MAVIRTEKTHADEQKEKREKNADGDVQKLWLELFKPTIDDEGAKSSVSFLDFTFADMAKAMRGNHDPVGLMRSMKFKVALKSHLDMRGYEVKAAFKAVEPFIRIYMP